MAAVATQEIRADSYVGFETITRQIEHKLLKRGFQFNVIVVGTCRTTRCKATTVMPANAPPSLYRADWSWKVDDDQHYLRVAPYGFEGTAGCR